MNSKLKWLTVIGIAVLVSALVLGGIAITGVLAQGPVPWGSPGSFGPRGMMGGWGSNGTTGPGMMGGWGSNGTMGPGMMGGWGPGGMMGPGMMGGWGSPGTGTRLTPDQALARAQQYVAAYGNPDLALAEVMEFSNNFYAEVKEQSTGIHAFELLLNPYTGAVYPEPGPNMMWNTKYGHMGGMMGGWWGRTNGPMTVTPEQARTDAQQFLNGYLPGTTVADDADAFYGYYTIHVLRDDKVIGMLSVNGYTGQVWYHTWHGDYIGMSELEG